MEFNFSIRFLGGVFNVTDNTWSRVFVEKIERLYSKLSPQKMEQIAKMLADEQILNLLNARTYFGTAVAPLKPSTIKRKGHARPFFEKGILFNTPTYKQINDTRWLIYLKDVANRNKIGFWLQMGRRDMKARPFFGVGAYMMQKVNKILTSE